MAATKLLVELPAFLVCKLDSVNGTLQIKQVLGVVFTEFFASDVYTSANAVTQREANQLYQDLNALIDRAFAERNAQKADSANLLRPKRKQ